MTTPQPKICNPWNPRNKLIPKQVILGILREYGIRERIPNLAIFQQACIHTSYKNKADQWAKQEEPMILAERPSNCLPLQEEDNEELEYVGDGLLSGVIAPYLAKRFTGRGEGFMTNLRTAIVNNDRLGELAKTIGFAPWLVISRHVEDMCDGRNNLRLLGSMFEAWLGALYESVGGDGLGYHLVKTFVLSVVERHIYFAELLTKNTNYKDQLLRFFQATYHEPPRYRVVHEEGPSHDRVFTMGVVGAKGEIVATSTARNKKDAEQEASRIALEILQRKTVDGVNL